MLHPDYQLRLAEIDHQRRVAAARRHHEYRAGMPRADAWLTRVFRANADAATTDTGAIVSVTSSTPAAECR